MLYYTGPILDPCGIPWTYIRPLGDTILHTSMHSLPCHLLSAMYHRHFLYPLRLLPEWQRRQEIIHGKLAFLHWSWNKNVWNFDLLATFLTHFKIPCYPVSITINSLCTFPFLPPNLLSHCFPLVSNEAIGNI